MHYCVNSVYCRVSAVCVQCIHMLAVTKLYCCAVSRSWQSWKTALAPLIQSTHSWSRCLSVLLEMRFVFQHPLPSLTAHNPSPPSPPTTLPSLTNTHTHCCRGYTGHGLPIDTLLLFPSLTHLQTSPPVAAPPLSTVLISPVPSSRYRQLRGLIQFCGSTFSFWVEVHFTSMCYSFLKFFMFVFVCSEYISTCTVYAPCIILIGNPIPPPPPTFPFCRSVLVLNSIWIPPIGGHSLPPRWTQCSPGRATGG